MALKLSRRAALASAAAAGALSVAGLPAHASPRHGGTYRIGMSGGNTSDTWDSRTHSDAFMINLGAGCVFETLTEVSSSGELTGELATSWSATPDAKVWTFNLRRGVKFHDGKRFGADDVIASMMMHVEPDAKSAAKPIVDAVAEMKKLSNYQVQFILKSGSADFPYLMSDYHICIFPAGRIAEAIARGIGTGPYRNVSFEPGVRALAEKFDDHWDADNRGYFNEVEQIYIGDAAARVSALLTNQVDAINRLDFKSVKLVKTRPDIEVLEATGNQHNTFPMLTGTPPYNDINVRRAIKHAVNRQEMVDKVLLGHGAIGNDHPIGPANQYYARDCRRRRTIPTRRSSIFARRVTQGSTSNSASQRPPSPAPRMLASSTRTRRAAQASTSTLSRSLRMATGPMCGSRSHGWPATGRDAQPRTGCSPPTTSRVCVERHELGKCEIPEASSSGAQGTQHQTPRRHLLRDAEALSGGWRHGGSDVPELCGRQVGQRGVLRTDRQSVAARQSAQREALVDILGDTPLA